MWYIAHGTKATMSDFWSNDKSMEDFIELKLDGKKLEMPDVEGIIVSNLPSYGAGLNLEGTEKTNYVQSVSDGLLEVYGIKNAFSMAEISMRKSSALKLGQAKCVEIQYKQFMPPIPIQIDGEPKLLDRGAQIKIEHMGLYPMLARALTVESLRPHDISGFLTKETGKFKSWKTRYFVLKGQELFYYLTVLDEIPKKKINLSEGTKIKEHTNSSFRNRVLDGFEIHLQQKIYKISCGETKESAEIWIQKLLQAGCHKLT